MDANWIKTMITFALNWENKHKITKSDYNYHENDHAFIHIVLVFSAK